MQLYCFLICNIQNKTKCLYRVDREVGNSLFSLQSPKFLQDRYIPLTFNVWKIKLKGEGIFCTCNFSNVQQKETKDQFRTIPETER